MRPHIRPSSAAQNIQPSVSLRRISQQTKGDNDDVPKPFRPIWTVIKNTRNDDL
jgi:hypothetical protein